MSVVQPLLRNLRARFERINIGGAGAIVTRDVPPYAVVGGNPARVIRYRFDRDTVERLMSIEWWNWSEARLRKEAGFLMELHEAPGA